MCEFWSIKAKLTLGHTFNDYVVLWMAPYLDPYIWFWFTFVMDKMKNFYAWLKLYGGLDFWKLDGIVFLSEMASERHWKLYV